MRKWLLILLIGLLPVAGKAIDPPWTASPKGYTNLRYFYNEYTRQLDGVYAGSATFVNNYNSYTSSNTYIVQFSSAGIYADMSALQTQVNNLQALVYELRLSTGVTQIIAGSNVTISPASGIGAVTINSTGGGGATNYVLYNGAYVLYDNSRIIY